MLKRKQKQPTTIPETTENILVKDIPYKEISELEPDEIPPEDNAGTTEQPLMEETRMEKSSESSGILVNEGKLKEMVLTIFETLEDKRRERYRSHGENSRSQGSSSSRSKRHSTSRSTSDRTYVPTPRDSEATLTDSSVVIPRTRVTDKIVIQGEKRRRTRSMFVIPEEKAILSDDDSLLELDRKTIKEKMETYEKLLRAHDRKDEDSRKRRESRKDSDELRRQDEREARNRSNGPGKSTHPEESKGRVEQSDPVKQIEPEKPVEGKLGEVKVGFAPNPLSFDLLSHSIPSDKRIPKNLPKYPHRSTSTTLAVDGFQRSPKGKLRRRKL